jgi:ABC-type phosphate/phosphonate transport system substrate-binding protein
MHMNRIRCRIRLLVLVVTFVFVHRSESAEPRGAAAPIRMGLVRSMFRDKPDPLIRLTTTAFEALMLDQTGLAGKTTVPGDAAALSRMLKEGTMDIGAFHGFEYAWAKQQNPNLMPLVLCVKRQRFVGAVLIVRADCKAADAAAFQGKTLALSQMARQHCHLFLDRRCVGKGKSRDEWFGKVCTPRTDLDALDDVAEGNADVAVVDDVDWKLFRETYPKTAGRLRVLKESEIFPATVIAYQKGTLEEATLKRLRDGLIKGSETERGRTLLGFFGMSGFAAVPDDYEKNVADILKAYPPPKSGAE